jgi:hypothetical protein
VGAVQQPDGLPSGVHPDGDHTQRPAIEGMLAAGGGRGITPP